MVAAALDGGDYGALIETIQDLNDESEMGIYVLLLGGIAYARLSIEKSPNLEWFLPWEGLWMMPSLHLEFLFSSRNRPD
jgi:hypothetical protein